jgi:hypothetical protein
VKGNRVRNAGVFVRSVLKNVADAPPPTIPSSDFSPPPYPPPHAHLTLKEDGLNVGLLGEDLSGAGATRSTTWGGDGGRGRSEGGLEVF